MAGTEPAPIIVIVGETGSGKSALALELAERLHGEIIAADSRTVYAGMDIGTAKPTAEERRRVPHFGLDAVTPDRHFSAYGFKHLAEAAIAEITARGHLPIVVGGTGLYVDALIYNFAFRPAPSEAERAALGLLSVAELQARVCAAGLALPANARNPRHLQRLLEGGASPRQPRVLRPNTVVLGVSWPREQLRERIAARVEHMVQDGLIDEVRTLSERYGDVEALRAPGYRAFRRYLAGELNLAEAKAAFARGDLQLAKRQRAWFKRSSDIQWLDIADRLEAALYLITERLHVPPDSSEE